MRTIDADILKKVTAEVYKAYDGYDPNDLWRFAERIDELIDNAPTVRNEYMRGYEAAMREYKRPKGDWIDERFADHYNQYFHTCNNCGATIEETAFDNFCSNCGADMRKGE